MVINFILGPIFENQNKNKLHIQNNGVFNVKKVGKEVFSFVWPCDSENLMFVKVINDLIFVVPNL